MKSYLITTVLLAAAFTPVTPAHAAADMCLGMPVTIVGSPGEDVTGTEGPDVVIANGAGQIDTLGGDDRVCVHKKGTFTVDTGQGDDQVEWSTRGYGGSIDLGAGSDTYTGGDQGSFVDTGDRADARAGLPLGTDTIVTGSGQDRVLTGNTNVFLPNADSIQLGRGRDDAVVRGAVPVSLDGGGGRDVLYAISAQRGTWTVDGATGVLNVDGVAMPPATSFSDYWLAGLRWDSLTFTGGPGSELVKVSGASGLVKNDGPFTADMGGGKDKLFVRSQDTGPFDGGDGDADVLWVSAKRTATGPGRFVADLQDDYFEITGESDPVSVPGFEHLSVTEVDNAIVRGDDDNNRLGAYGCGNQVFGRAGNDRIDGGATKGCYDDDTSPGLTAQGGEGNDVLEGGPSRDRLIGGPGRDKADGWYGRDQCVAEVEESCER